jgi:hypothetical protein
MVGGTGRVVVVREPCIVNPNSLYVCGCMRVEFVIAGFGGVYEWWMWVAGVMDNESVISVKASG